jgi:hypothetical protein
MHVTHGTDDYQQLSFFVIFLSKLNHTKAFAMQFEGAFYPD